MNVINKKIWPCPIVFFQRKIFLAVRARIHQKSRFIFTGVKFCPPPLGKILYPPLSVLPSLQFTGGIDLTVSLSISFSICLCMSLSFLTVYQSLCLFVCLSSSLSICLSVSLSVQFLYISMCYCLTICLSVSS